MLHAERKTGRNISTRYEWSPALKRSVNSFRYWQLRFRQAQHLNISLPRLNNLQSLAGISAEEATITSVDLILQRLQQAANELRQHL